MGDALGAGRFLAVAADDDMVIVEAKRRTNMDGAGWWFWQSR
jgi:hypothetical protein